MPIAYFDRFEIEMTIEQAQSAFHQGQCHADAVALRTEIGKEIDPIPADVLREELKQYGAWDDEELSDDAANRIRITWIASGNIVEESK